MPRYNQPNERLSPQDRRLQQLSVLSNLAAQQDQQQLQHQAAMLQAAQQMYGLQQEQQMGPERLRALQAENTGREQQNQLGASNAAWQEPMMQQKFATGQSAQKQQELQQAGEQQKLDWLPTQQGQAFNEGESRIKVQGAEANAKNQMANYYGAEAKDKTAATKERATAATAVHGRDILDAMQARYMGKQMGYTPEQIEGLMQGKPPTITPPPEPVAHDTYDTGATPQGALENRAGGPLSSIGQTVGPYLPTKDDLLDVVMPGLGTAHKIKQAWPGFLDYAFGPKVTQPQQPSYANK